MPPSIRHRALEEWRGLPEPDKNVDRMLSIGEVLYRLAPQLGLEDRLREEEIIGTWVEIVGDFFGRHSRPVKLQEGVLFINVLQPTVLYELNLRWKPLVLEKLKARFGKLIKELRFRLG